MQAPSFNFSKRLCPAGAAGVLCLNIFNKAAASNICTWCFRLTAAFDQRRQSGLAGLKLMTRCCGCNCFRGTSDESRREVVRQGRETYLCNYFIDVLGIFTPSCRVGKPAVKHPNQRYRRVTGLRSGNSIMLVVIAWENVRIRNPGGKASSQWAFESTCVCLSIS